MEQNNTSNVTRAHLKNAVDTQNWDLLDKLLELSSKHINDASYYTDGWGEWWGLLLECVYKDAETGVRVLLKHGASRKLGSWGDCIPTTPVVAATEKPAILALLRSKNRPNYTRKTNPALPTSATELDHAVNQQGQIRDETGLVFQTNALTERNNLSNR